MIAINDGKVLASAPSNSIPGDVTVDSLVFSGDGQWLAARGPNISELTFEALSRYDVGRLKPGTTYASRHPEQRGLDGVRIPRLAVAKKPQI